MHEIFLGKPWHWLLVAVITALLWWAGAARLHVIEFNSFIIVLLLGGLAIVLLILRTTKEDEQITREPLTKDLGEDDS